MILNHSEEDGEIVPIESLVFVNIFCPSQLLTGEYFCDYLHGRSLKSYVKEARGWDFSVIPPYGRSTSATARITVERPFSPLASVGAGIGPLLWQRGKLLKLEPLKQLRARKCLTEQFLSK